MLLQQPDVFLDECRIERGGEEYLLASQVSIRQRDTKAADFTEDTLKGQELQGCDALSALA